MAQKDILQQLAHAKGQAIQQAGGIQTKENTAVVDAITKSLFENKTGSSPNWEKSSAFTSMFDSKPVKTTYSEAEKRRVANPKADTRTAEQKMNAAQRALNIHNAVQGEKKPVEKTPLQKAMDDLFRQPAGASVSDAPVQMDKSLQQPDQDARRKELEATVEHYRQQMQQEESQRVRDADMKEIESWSDEDREQLRQYISSENKTNNLFVNSNPLLWFGANKALGDSAKYLYGKYGEEKTKQLASSYSRYLNEEEARKIQEDTKEAVNRSTMSAIGHNILGVGTRLFGGLQATADRFGEALDRDERYPTLAPFVSGDLMSLHGNTVTAQTAQNIAGEDGGILRQGAAYLYQGGMTMVDSFVRAAAGGGAGGAAALAACNAFSQTVSDASRQGATPEQAYTLGTAVAGVEYLSEKIPMDELLKTAKGGVGKIMPVLIATMKQAGIEAATEELSLLGTLIAEASLLQEKSSYAQTINALVANGATIEEATAQADAQVWQEAKDTAIISALSGGMSGFASGKQGQNMAVQKQLAALNEPKQEQPESGSPPLPDMAQQAQNTPEGTQPNEVSSSAPGASVTDEGQRIIEATGKQLAEAAPEDGQHTLTEGEINANRAAEAIFWQQQKSQSNKGRQEVYQALQAAKREQKNLEKEIDKTESKIKLQGKGSPARVNRLKTELERQNKLVSQLESQYGYFAGDYEKTVEAAVARQDALFQQARSAAQQAIADYNSGLISEAQMNSAQDAYNNAGQELYRLNHMTQEQYAAELAQVGLIADNEPRNINIPQSKPDPESRRRIAEAITQSWEQMNGGENLRTPTIEELSQKQDVAVVRIGRNTEGKDYSQLKADISQKAEQEKWYDAPYFNHDTGMPVFLTKKTLTHSYSNLKSDHGTDTLLALQHMPEIVENAVLVNVAPPKNTNKPETRVLTFFAAADGENGTVPVKLTVKEYSSTSGNPMPQDIQRFFEIAKLSGNFDSLYDLEALEIMNPKKTKKEFDASAIVAAGSSEPSANSTSNSTIKVSELLGIVKGDAAKYIPKSVVTAQGGESDIGTLVQPAEGGQDTKGTGAAEQNFTGKAAYNATLSEDNSQADRRSDVRSMELPRIDVNGRNISAVTGNVYGSRNTPDDLASAMEEPTARGDFSYEKITNNQATERALKNIERAGSWDSAYSQFQRDVGEGKAGAELSARAALLLNHAAQEYQAAKDSGNEELAASKKREWLGILSDVQRLGTNTAQGQQAMRIIRSLMPQDKLEFAKASVQRMAADMRIDVTIDQNLLDQYENAETDEARNEILGQIQQNVADQIPSTMLDKFTALRYTNMLGNLKTNVRNVAGNLGSKAVYKMKDAVATVMEEIASAATGGKFQKTKSMTVDPVLLEACRRDFQEYKDLVSSGGKYGDRLSDSDQFRQGVMDKRHIFNNPVMEGYRKATNWLMNNEYFGDEAFGKSAYSRALAGYLKANGVKGYDLSKVDSALMDKARAYAIKEAQEATFHDNSALSRIVSKAQKGFGWVGQGVMPFTKTPANVLTRAEEFSPLGLINSTVKSLQKAASGTKLTEGNGRIAQWAQNGQDITGADIINSWAKTLTGTALFALGAAMLDQGLLTGGPDEDGEKEAFETMNGQQNYAIQLPDGTTYTIDWLTPAAMPMFMGAQLWKIVSENGGLSGLNYADYEQVFTAIADPMLQMSMLSGLNDTLGNIQNADNNLGQFFLNAAVSYLSQGLSNTLLGQIERSTEKNRQTTYIDKDSSTPQWLQRQLGSISQKIPGWDYQQADYINAWGEKQENKSGLGYNLLSPGYLNETDNSELTQELTRLRETTGENIFPDNASKTITYTDSSGEVHKDYNLTPEQYETLATTQGQTAKAMIGQMIKSKDYQTMDDDQKAKAIEQVYSYAKIYAEKKAIEDHTGFSESWMMELDEPTSEQAVKKGTDYIMRRVAKSDLTNAFSSLNTAWDKGYKDSGRADDLKWAYDVFAAMTPAAKADVKEWLSGDSAKYVEAREKGVTHEQFLSAAKNVNTVKGTGKNGAVKDIDKRQAIAETDGIPDAVIDKIMKAYMEDYDPDESGSEKTELKYDYIRHGLGLSPAQYAETYRASLDNDKKNDKIAAIMALGYDRSTATTLYNVYDSNTAGKNAYMGYYEKNR